MMLARHFIKNKFYSKSILYFTLITLIGCSNMGSQAVRKSKTDYNIAIEQTDNEQLLLNLVRLRYRDTHFL